MTSLSLVIPCFNEALNLPLLLPRCAEAARAMDGEVVLVDNGSRDDTPGVLAQLLPLYPECRSIRIDENQGYGAGILAGLKAARSDLLAWTHADMQTDPMDAIEGLKRFHAGGEPANLFVKGRRYGRPLSDVVFSIGMAAFETVLMQTAMQDINAQPTMFSRSFFERWRDPPRDFSLDLFAYYQAKRMDLVIERIPVQFGSRAHGLSHWNVDLGAKLKFIRRTISYSLELRRGLSK